MTPTILQADDTKVSSSISSVDPNILQNMDPEFISFYEEVLAKSKPTHEVPIEEVRANPSKYAAVWAYDSKDEPRIQNYDIESKDGALVPIRCYYPDPAKFGLGPYSVHINFHGGGFVFGSFHADAKFCMTLRDRLSLVVVDVNYRHCPETIMGKNIEDAWAVLSWVRDSSGKLNIIKSSVSLGGISAGGYLSCILQHLARDDNVPLKLVIPAVPPVTDCCSYKKLEDSPYESFRRYSRAPLLNWARLSYFQQYAFPDDKVDEIRSLWPEWWLAPIKAPNFTNLCDTFLITAEIDPLRDEGEDYGKKLVAAGNKVTFRRYLGVPHPFMHMTDYLQKARDYDEDIISALKAAHGL
ncbi:hypothetical protein TMatcc_001168 [Talaromyces marneffei ATCC 18224]|nr:hypothetical protein EYB25_008627 [Talaromyces marneffei]